MGSSMLALRPDVSIEKICVFPASVFLGASDDLLNSQTRAHALSRHINTGLFKRQGRVYFETIRGGGVSKFFVPDSELPMISGMYRCRETD